MNSSTLRFEGQLPSPLWPIHQLLLVTLTVLLAASAAVAQPAASPPAPAVPAVSKAAAAKAAAAERRAQRAAEQKSRAEAAARAKASKRNRAAAAQHLKRIGQVPAGPERYKEVDALLALGDDGWPLAEAALPKLAVLVEGEAVVVDLLLGYMPRSYDALLGRAPKLSDGAASRVLRFVLKSVKEDERQVALLVTMLPRSDPRVLLMVLPPLQERAHAEVMPRLVQLVDSADAALQAYAIDMIAASRYAPARGALARLLGVEQRRATPANKIVRIKLINALARIGGEPSVAPLMEALSLPDQRRAVLDGLKLIGQPAVQNALMLLQVSSGDRIQLALELLTHMRQLAAPQLVKLLAHGDRETRNLAMDVLAHMNVAETRDMIVEMVQLRRLVDPADGVRLAITLYDASVRKLLIDLLADKNPELRIFVIEQMWRLRDPETFAALQAAAVSDPDRTVRLAALKAIGGLGHPQGADFLRRMTRVPDEDMRIAILNSLARIDTWSRAVPIIAPLLADPNEAVHRAALSSLRRLSFRAGQRREGPWKAWWHAEQERSKGGHETLRPAERRFRAETGEQSYLEAGEGRPTIVAVSGPPFRDCSHMMPHVWRLAEDHQVVVMQRRPGPYRAAVASDAERERELQALLGRLGVRPVVLLADASGAHFALRYATLHNRDVSRIILHGAFWPTAAAVERLPGQVDAAIRNEMRPDLLWGMRAQWRAPRAVAQRAILRGVLSGVLANWESARQVNTDSLAIDAFSLDTLDRVRESLRASPIVSVNKPVLLLVGQKAPWLGTTRQDVKKLRGKSRKRVLLKVVPNAGWNPLLENPSTTVDLIDDFLN